MAEAGRGALNAERELITHNIASSSAQAHNQTGNWVP
jgi:hypothetical protein